MPRLTISRKVFITFFILTGFTCLLATTVYTGIQSLNRENRKLLIIRDFQLQINKVDSLILNALQHHNPVSRDLFNKELDQILVITKQMENMQEGAEESLALRLRSLPEHIKHYRGAYEELYGRYTKEDSLMLMNKNLLSSLEKDANPLPRSVQEGFLQALLSYNDLQEKFLLYRRAEDIKAVKKLGVTVDRMQIAAGLKNDFQTLILNLENYYFNDLAIQDREKFLSETSTFFSGITADIISMVSQRIKQKQSHLNATIFVIILLSIATTVTFWLLVSSYVRRFLRNLKKAITSIRSGDYDYVSNHHSRDEFGELTAFMKEMSLDLMENINKVQKGEKFLQEILDGIAEPILLIDPQYNIRLMNKRARENAGIGETAIESLKCHSVSHKSDAPCRGNAHPCPLAEILETKKPVIVEHEHFDHNGDKRSIEIMASPLLGDNGSLEGIIEASRDITERKRLEEQLRQSQKMEVIGRLAGGISHDFNNLLTIILGYSEIALSNLPDDSPVISNLAAISSAGERAAALTSQLLAFSRKQVLHIHTLNLNSIIDDMIHLLERVIGEDMEISFRPDTQARNIRVDKSQIEQVIMNLAVNARDAMPSGGSLIIETGHSMLDDEYSKNHEGVKPGSYVVLTVADNGAGISKEVQEKIFEPFFTTKDHGKGTGLGLATVFGIVKQHEGHIYVYSEPGKGTTFKIYLPEAEGTAETISPRRPVTIRQGNETIMIVDDMKSIRQLAVDALRPLGYNVIEASSGEEALRLIQQEKRDIDILVTDVVMPGMNGSELASRLHETNPETKIIFMSGYTDNMITRKGMLREGLHFLDKPLMPSNLTNKIREVLDGK